MAIGDNLNTACAIARQCGILTDEGQAVFRKITPASAQAAVDEILPHLQVVARSSPEGLSLLDHRLKRGVGSVSRVLVFLISGQ
jgi:P-type Ca2+ transporter type 2C